MKYGGWILKGSIASLVALALLWNPVGLWPFILLAIFGVWVEVGNLIVAVQMRRELRQVLNG